MCTSDNVNHALPRQQLQQQNNRIKGRKEVNTEKEDETNKRDRTSIKRKKKKTKKEDEKKPYSYET